MYNRVTKGEPNKTLQDKNVEKELQAFVAYREKHGMRPSVMDSPVEAMKALKADQYVAVVNPANGELVHYREVGL
jgi:hypothetical protein